MKEIGLGFIQAYNWLILLYFLGLNGTYILLNVLSFFAVRRYLGERKATELKKVFQSTFFKPISIIAPAYNEEETIAESVKSFLQLQYPEHEVVVVDDGSTDNTMKVLIETYKMVKAPITYAEQIDCKRIKGIYVSPEYTNLVLVNKENGGKGDALNAGINIARYPLVCFIDADSLLESDALLKVVRPFLENLNTVAVGGIVRISNGCKVKAGRVIEVGTAKNSLVRFQIVEYLRTFLFGRTGWDVLNGMLIISGAFGLFSKEAVMECGGYRNDTVGEDMELVVRLHRTMRKKKRQYRITFIADPVCWTQVPEKLKILSRQRSRWQRGLMDSMLFNIKMLFNPKYGIVGLVAMPFFFFFEMLGPIAELTGYIVFFVSWYFNIVSFTFALFFLAAAIVLGIVLSMGSLVLEELSFRRYPKIIHLVILFAYAVLENFGYRQLNTWWRFRGFLDHILGKKGWGKMERKGFQAAKQ
ncbi:hypothetical protein ES703_82792 [subsurface metagenome]